MIGRNQLGQHENPRLPALLIALTAFFNNASYAMEFATFAIYFKQEHNWNEATWLWVLTWFNWIHACVVLESLGNIEHV